MKKANLTIIATIIATFVISMFAFQPAKAEAGNGVVPNAMPTPRKIKPKKPIGFDHFLEIEGVKAKAKARKLRKMPRQTIEVENDETHRTRKRITKVKTKKPASAANVKTGKQFGTYGPVEHLTQKRKASKNEVSIETIERRKHPRKRKN